MALEAILRAFARWLLPEEYYFSFDDSVARKPTSFGSYDIPGSFEQDERREFRGESLASLAKGSNTAGENTMDIRLMYNNRIADARPVEYPQLRSDQLYLDHAGTTVPSRSLIAAFSESALTSLLGNPHSGSAGLASLNASHMADNVRLEVLRWFHADPEHFDVVFVANATAGIKLVAEGIRGWATVKSAECSTETDRSLSGYVPCQSKARKCWLGYHVDSHTSIVGLREEFDDSVCFANDGEVHKWLGSASRGQNEAQKQLKLLAYPAQSNMTGRKLPLSWLSRAKVCGALTLLDAAALAPTSVVNLADVDSSPDFTVFSFYKMFGMPDLGALLVKKSAGKYLRQKRYFGGGTVETVTVIGERWHIRKDISLHETLEDGTLPIHSLSMLHAAFSVQRKLFGFQSSVEAHTQWLTSHLYDSLSVLKHYNGIRLCIMHGDRKMGDYGPTLAFNMRDFRGVWISNFEFEKLASVRNIQVRTGAVCNPGGTATALNLNAWEMQSNFSAGARCGGEQDVMNGKPTGVVRISLGAMSILDDVQRFVSFVREFFVEEQQPEVQETQNGSRSVMTGFRVDQLTVYPIKSCAGWTVPSGMAWQVRPEGLAWDREWCLVHQGTGIALSQKAFPEMALLQPELDLTAGSLTVRYTGPDPAPMHPPSIRIPLSKDPDNFVDGNATHCSSSVCGDKVNMLLYTSKEVNAFFSRVLDTPCTLARYPSASTSQPSKRHAKPHLQSAGQNSSTVPLLLSNESPILVLSKSSLERLNENAKDRGSDRVVLAAAFRANILLAEDGSSTQPFIEDQFKSITIHSKPSRITCNLEEGRASDQQYSEQNKLPQRQPTVLKILGRCRRCQMVCIDPKTGERSRSGEPFATLAKTRRSEGKVWFGLHAALEMVSGSAGGMLIQAGDLVEAEMRGDD